MIGLPKQIGPQLPHLAFISHFFYDFCLYLDAGLSCFNKIFLLLKAALYIWLILFLGSLTDTISEGVYKIL